MRGFNVKFCEKLKLVIRLFNKKSKTPKIIKIPQYIPNPITMPIDKKSKINFLLGAFSIYAL